MGISNQWIACVAVTVCLLRPGDLVTMARPSADVDVVHAEPCAGGRQATAESGRRMPERFLVGYQGYALLGPDGEERVLIALLSGAVSENEPQYD